MNGGNNTIFEFGAFRLNPREKQLWRGGELVYLPPKEFDTLWFLVKNNGHLVEKAELMHAIWGDTIVEEGNLNLIISNLRKTLGDDTSKPEYIETVRKRGYRFIAAVREIQDNINKEEEAIEASGQTSGLQELPVKELPVNGELQKSDRKSWTIWIVLGLVLLFGIAAALLVWARLDKAPKGLQPDIVEIHSPFDEIEVKRVVRESQIYETLTIYTNPKAFDKSQLSKYWLPEELGGKEIQHVQASVERLLKKGWHYENGSKAEIFEFRYIKIFAPGDYAEAGTMERWYLPTCYEDGSRVLDKNVYIGPQAMDYKLRKINDTWLIEETTVPRPQSQPNPTN